MDKNEINALGTQPTGCPIQVTRPKPKMPNKLKEALVLPVCVNLNPRSLYNKSSAFTTFIKEHQVGCVFLSESWERPEYDLSKLIDIEDYTVVSNPHQRKGKGGRPALVINTKNYHVRNLTNTLI